MIRNTYHEHYNRRSSIGSFCKVHMLVRAGKLLPLLFCVCLIIPQAVFAQCPANEADLADGGTFSGTCNVTVGGEVLITGAVIWNGGDLNILGSAGSIDVQSGGSLTINSGNVLANDGASGSIYVRSGGAITVASGASLTTDLRIHVYGELTIDGTLTSDRGRLEIFDGGTTTLNATGTFTTGGTGDTNVQGAFVINGTFASNGDMEISGAGADVTIGAGVTFTVDDLLVENGASLTVNGSGTTIISTGEILADNGEITINAGVDLDIDALTVQNASVMTVNGPGTSVSTTGDVIIDNADVTLNDGVTFNAGDANTSSNDPLTVSNGGSLSINGSSTTVNTDDDVIVNGGFISVNGGSALNVGGTGSDDDLMVYGGGSVTIENGSTLNVQDDLLIGSSSAGLVINDGQINAGDDIRVSDTDPDSGLTTSGDGDISAGGTFTDDECDNYRAPDYHFCACNGQSGIGTCTSTLPITLINFSARMQEEYVVLEWSTATEVDNDFFTIERLNSDGEFEAILTVKGKGTSYSINHYSGIDYAPNLGNNYYRLKQTDFDGKSSYSEIVKVYFESSFDRGSIRVYPNPARNENIFIEFTHFAPQESVYIELSSITGVLYINNEIKTDPSGRFTIEIPQNQLPSGMYILKTNHQSASIQKVVVE